MLKDIKEIIKEYDDEKLEIPAGHRSRFENKLNTIKPIKKTNFLFLKIAASILILISVGFYFTKNNEIQPNIMEEKIDLATISPELKQIETNYEAAINFEMLGIEVTDNNRETLDSYLEKVAVLSDNYNVLSEKLITSDINENIVNALIDNLQLRLQLLLELKDKLKEIKINTVKSNENSI